MTLPSGTISLSQVNVELTLSATAQISLNQANVRTLAGVPSGTISMNNLRGKTYVFAFTIASNQIDANLRTLAINAGWNGSTPVQATINSGVFISGSVAANSTAALTINGSFPNGITLINNGTIAGRGGTGGVGGRFSPETLGGAGQAGGLALLASVGVTIQNNGTIAGGGGGGGGGSHRSTSTTCSMGDDNSANRSGGGGGGGGRSNASYNASGGAGGVTAAINCGTLVNGSAGGTGTSSAAGGAGAAGSVSSCTCSAQNGSAGAGGAGGEWGTAGSAGQTSRFAGGAGGAAGQAVSGNSNITWTAFGTRSGPIV